MVLVGRAMFGTSLHAEKLWLAARSLGREFGQNAVFEVADGMLRVHACFDGWIDERPL